MLTRHFFLTCVFAVTAAAQPSPTREPARTWHDIYVATLEDSGEQIAIIDWKAFRTVEALLAYVAALPSDTSAISFRTYNGPKGGNKFAAAAEELKEVCDQHRIQLFLRTRPAEE
jgi:hypothetical protein